MNKPYTHFSPTRHRRNFDGVPTKLWDLDRPRRTLSVFSNKERTFLGVNTGTKRSAVEVDTFELLQVLLPNTDPLILQRELG